MAEVPREATQAFDRIVRDAEERMYDRLDALRREHGLSDADITRMIEDRVDVAEGWRDYIDVEG